MLVYLDIGDKEKSIGFISKESYKDQAIFRINLRSGPIFLSRST